MNQGRILLVDDSPAMRAFIRRVLELTGEADLEYIEAANGQEALDYLHSNNVDLVICDVNMPVMNGEGFLHALQLWPEQQRPPVLVVSTDSTRTRVARMIELGAAGYIPKPFTPEAMRDVIGRVGELVRRRGEA